MRDLLKPRTNVRPVEYPEFEAFKDAIRHSYWLHTEFNLSEDVNDYLTKTTVAERSAMKNTMLAIAQVEVAVKAFWGDLSKYYPKPEVGDVGATFSESEIRHKDAYAHLLEILGLNEAFQDVHESSPLGQRVAFLNKRLQKPNTGDALLDGRWNALRLLLFSAFVEHTSLFGQFLIMKAFNRERNLFKGIANIVEATSKEEQIHGMFGYKLIEVLRVEHPEWFDDSFREAVFTASSEALVAELKILDWVFEAGELAFLPKAVVADYLAGRFNLVLRSVGFEERYHVNPRNVAATRWFDEELFAGKHYDFFNKRPTAYSKKGKAITADDLF